MQLIRGGTNFKARRGAALTLVAALVALCGACGSGGPTNAPQDPMLVAQGKDIFRFDSYGDESPGPTRCT